MKTFIIFKTILDAQGDVTSYLDRLGSYEAEEKEDNSTNRSHLQVSPHATHFELPEGLDVDVVKPALVEGEWVLVEDSTLITEKVIATKTGQITEKHVELEVDVYAEMKNVFGTSNSESASAYHETWKMMVSSPSDYSGEGLTASLNTTSFNQGDALNTDNAITNYANECISSANAYSIYRMKRIEQFKVEKHTIETGE
jgi:hypothetical protein